MRAKTDPVVLCKMTGQARVMTVNEGHFSSSLRVGSLLLMLPLQSRLTLAENS